MKCRKNDRVVFKDGAHGTIIKGTNSENGWILVRKYLVRLGHMYEVSENSKNIVKITRKGKVIWEA